MKIALLILFVFIALLVHSQDTSWTYVLSDTLSFLIPSSKYTYVNADLAQQHIDSNTMMIFFVGEIGGGLDFENKVDSAFQEKYQIDFVQTGCIKIIGDDQVGYNKIIFEFLDSKYGNEWRDEIKEGVLD